MDVASNLVRTLLPVPEYRTMVNIPETGMVTPHTLDSLTHIDCYMDDLITAVQGGSGYQHQVFDGTVQALRRLFSSLPREMKDSVNAKKLQMGEGDWTCVKGVLGWTIDTEAGTVAPPKQKFKS